MAVEWRLRWKSTEFKMSLLRACWCWERGLFGWGNYRINLRLFWKSMFFQKPSFAKTLLSKDTRPWNYVSSAERFENRFAKDLTKLTKNMMSKTVHLRQLVYMRKALRRLINLKSLKILGWDRCNCKKNSLWGISEE